MKKLILLFFFFANTLFFAQINESINNGPFPYETSFEESLKENYLLDPPTITLPTTSDEEGQNPPKCNEGKGFAPFNLEAMIPTILGSQSSADFTVSFHNSENGATTDTDVLNVQDLSKATVTERTIYIRVENNDTEEFATQSLFLDVKNCKPDMPNAFSPNNDNVNDVFAVYGLKDVFYNFKFTVYNRWGNVVFTTNNDKVKYDTSNKGYALLWDGEVNGVISNESESATYYYVLELNDSEIKPLKGTIYVNP